MEKNAMRYLDAAAPSVEVTRVGISNGMAVPSSGISAELKVVVPGATKVEYNGMSDCYEPAVGSWHSDSVIMHYFAEQIRGGGADARTHALRQRHVIEIIDKLYASSLSGTASKLETA